MLRKTAIAAVACNGLLLAATQSHAVVVATGVVSLAVPSTTNGLCLNVVTGASNLGAGTGGSTVSGWDRSMTAGPPVLWRQHHRSALAGGVRP